MSLVSEEKNSVVSIVRYFILIVVKQNSIVSVVSGEKQRSERSQIFCLNSSEVKHCGEHSQRFPFNSSEVKQRNEGSK